MYRVGGFKEKRQESWMLSGKQCGSKSRAHCKSENETAEEEDNVTEMEEIWLESDEQDQPFVHGDESEMERESATLPSVTSFTSSRHGTRDAMHFSQVVVHIVCLVVE